MDPLMPDPKPGRSPQWRRTEPESRGSRTSRLANIPARELLDRELLDRELLDREVLGRADPSPGATLSGAAGVPFGRCGAGPGWIRIPRDERPD
jgi:hypothetical protein